MLVRLWSGDQDLEIIKTKVLVRERGHRLRHDKFCLCVAWSPNPNACITMIILNECVPVIMRLICHSTMLWIGISSSLFWSRLPSEANLGRKGFSIHYATGSNALLH